MASIVSSLSVVLLVVGVLKVQGWDYSETPNVQWQSFTSGSSYFAFPLTSLNGRDLCEPVVDPATSNKVVLCDTEVRNRLYDANKQYGDDYDLEHTTAQCAEAGDLPKDVKKVCWVRVHRGSWRKLGVEKKTELEIQFWSTGTTKTANARYSRPYND